MRISVFGIGYVGVVSCGCLAELGHEVVGVDISPEKLAMLEAGRSPIVEEFIDTLIADAVRQGRLTASADVGAAVAGTDVSFVSVGTPSAPNGSVALGAVDSVIEQIGAAVREKPGPHTVVMRSTVPPGTAEDRVIPLLERASGRKLGDRLAYYSNPEFLREGSSVRDFRTPPLTLIGAPPGDDAAILREIYAPVKAPVHVAPYRVAESVKHISNVYHAVKLAFANEAGAILSAYGVDAREAFRLLCEDRVLNVSPAYLRPGFAFGGSCLPKDVRSFLALADQRGAHGGTDAGAVASGQPGDHRPGIRRRCATWPPAGGAVRAGVQAGHRRSARIAVRDAGGKTPRQGFRPCESTIGFGSRSRASWAPTEPTSNGRSRIWSA